MSDVIFLSWQAQSPFLEPPAQPCSPRIGAGCAPGNAGNTMPSWHPPGTTHPGGCTSLGLELSVCPAKGQPWCMRHDQNSHVPGDHNYPWSSSDTYTWLPGLPAGFPGSICLWQLFPYTMQCANHFISLSLKKVVKNVSSIKMVLFLSLILPKICGRAWGFSPTSPNDFYYMPSFNFHYT